MSKTSLVWEGGKHQVLTIVLWLQRSYNLIFFLGFFFFLVSYSFFPYGILEGDVSYFSLTILMCESERVYNWFRNGTTWGLPRLQFGIGSAFHITSVNTGGNEAAGWKEGLRTAAVWGGSGVGTEHMGTPGGARVCLQGCRVNEFRLYMKMLNLFSRFPRHEQDPGALEPEGQLPHSFPEVSLSKKKKEKRQTACSIHPVISWWGAWIGWLG